MASVPKYTAMKVFPVCKVFIKYFVLNIFKLLNKSLVQTGYEFTITTNKNLFMKIVSQFPEA